MGEDHKKSVDTIGEDGLAKPEGEVEIENESLDPVILQNEPKIKQMFAEAGKLKVRGEELAEAARKIAVSDEARKLERERVLREAIELVTQASVLFGKIFTGGNGVRDTFIRLPQDKWANEAERQKKGEDALEDYREVMRDSPRIILKTARESGSLGAFRGIDGMSARLLRNEKFIEKLGETDAAKNDANFQEAVRDNLFPQLANNAEMARPQRRK